MIIVDDGESMIGKEVGVEVSSVVLSAGRKMIFVTSGKGV